MLLSLHIRNFAIIDQVDIDPGPGMTALTGETGAGKSILLDALGLLLGDRADTSTVRHDCERAEISASFDISRLDSVQQWLTDQDLNLGDECQLRRVIHRQGRSRGYINGSPVPVQSLRMLGEQLVDIHGQHEHQSLMRRDLQRQLLDRFGKHQKLLDQLSTLYQQSKQLQQQQDAILGGVQNRDSRLEFLRFQLQELNDLAPQQGEVEQLHEENKRLANAGQLLETCELHIANLYDNDPSAQSLLSRAQHDFGALADIDPAIREAGSLINSSLIQLQEAVDQLRDYQSRLTQDPQRLQWIEMRLDSLHSVARKHRIEAETLASFQAELFDELQKLVDADQHLQQLEQQQQQLVKDYGKLANKLHKSRVKTAASLADQVSSIMESLGMSGGRFIIEVQAGDNPAPHPYGRDQIEFLISANPGQPPKPLAKVASGGELSRISLAIQVVAAQATQIPTLIFDEVDSGVGGAVAETVGNQLQILGKVHQVLCVTHLPQVAAQAHHHLQVSKHIDKQTTLTRICELDSQETVEEIARMLGGKNITETTLQHAADMLQAART